MNPVQLALRVLRVDPRTRVSTLLTALGVAVASALVVFLITLPQAAERRAERAEWQSGDISAGPGNNSLANLDYVQGKEIVRLDVAGEPLIEGAPPLPGPGEVLLSPELAELVKELPPEQLADRFPGKVIATIDEQHLKYPEQLLAVLGHPPGALDPQVEASGGGGVALSDAESEFLLTFLAWVGIVLLTVPSLVLVASAARLTAARRERRLAALRLAGGTPGQVVATVAAETAIAAIGGTVLGMLLGWPLRSLLVHVPWSGGTWFVSDFAPSPLTLIGVGLAIPALVLLAAVFGLRRVVRAPLGAAMDHKHKKPSAWRLLVPVVVGLIFVYGLGQASESGSIVILLGGLAAVIVAASVVGPWVTAMIGMLFTKIWRGAPGLLAGRRLNSDPKSAYRATSGIVLAVFVGAMALTLLPGFESLSGGGREYKDQVLYVDVPVEESAQVKRRLDKRLGQQATVSETWTGALMGPGEQQYSAVVMDCEQARKSTRMSIGSCDGPPAIHAPASMGITGTGMSFVPTHIDPEEREQLALPPRTPVRPVGAQSDDLMTSILIDAALLPELPSHGDTTVAVAPHSEAERDEVRTAFALAAPGYVVDSREARLHRQDVMLGDLQRVTTIGLSIAAGLAGCSAAISAAGSVVDRRRTFGALIAAGTPARVLARALRTEAALPALVVTAGAGLTGVVVGSSLLTLFGAEGGFSVWVLVPFALGVVVAILAASACGPVLRRVSAEPFADE